MPRLLLLNGLPGSGKSTLARRWVDGHPLALALDVDVVRGLLGAWLDHAGEAGRLARRLALGMAREHLRAGYDVLVPQYLGQLEFLLDLQAVAGEVGVPFVEVVLVVDLVEVVERFARRSARPETAEHRDAWALLAQTGGPAELAAMHRRLLAVVAARPATRAVHVVDGEVDRAVDDLTIALSA